MTTPALTPTEVQAHAGHLRRLAGALVRDAGQADDLVQRTWMRALQSPPGDRTRLGGWLRRVLRNEARQAWRAEGRRAQREAASSSPMTPEDPSHVAARSEALADLLAHLRALPAPYRTPMLLRWVEGHAPGEIARRLATPGATVRSHLARGKAMLASRLDETHGDRRTWALGLAPMALPAGSAAGAALGAATLGGAFAMKKTLALGAAVLLIAGGVAWWTVAASPWDDSAEPAETAALSGTNAGPVDAGAASLSGHGGEQAGTEVDGAREDVDPVEGDVKAAGAWKIQGRAITEAPLTLEGARVQLHLVRGDLKEPVAAMDVRPDGTFAFDLQAWKDSLTFAHRAGDLRVRVTCPGHLPFVDRLTAWSDLEREGVDVTADLVNGDLIQGRVLDQDGEPVRGGTVAIQFRQDGDISHHFQHVDGDGHYRTPFTEARTVRAVATIPGRGTAETPWVDIRPGRDATLPDLVLRAEGSISGRALWPDGTPAPRVRIAAEHVGERTDAESRTGAPSSEAFTDDEGRFTLPGLGVGRYWVGHHQTPGPLPEDQVHDLGTTDALVVVRVRRVRFRVRDPEGNPVPGASYLLRTNLDAPVPDLASGHIAHEEDVVAYEGKPGTRVEFAVSIEEHPAVAAVGVVPRDRPETVVDVILRPLADTPRGRLVIHVTPPDGQALERSHIALDLFVGAASHYRQDLAGPGPYVLEDIPSGRWNLTVRAGARSAFQDRTLWFPHRSEVLVRPDQTTTRRISPRTGARLRITLDGTPSRDRITARLRQRGQTVSLGRFLTDLEDGRWRFSDLIVGRPGLSQHTLEAGAYTLEVLRGDTVFHTQPIRLTTGEILDVTVPLGE